MNRRSFLWTAAAGSAWADIRTYLAQVYAGQFQVFVACCTDGFRPVHFKIETC